LTEQKIFFHLKIYLICPPFCCNRIRDYTSDSLMPARLSASTHCISSLQQLSTKFVAVQADRGQLLSSRFPIHRCCGFYLATCPDWFCSIS